MKSLAWIALALVPAASAGTVTFPVGTPVEYDPFTLTFSVQRGPFVFSRFGGLSIHENADGNIHAGGLLLSWLSVDGPDQLAMQAPGGEPFRLASVTVAELSFAAGMRLVVTGVDAAGAFTVELPFDLDGQTYDTYYPTGNFLPDAADGFDAHPFAYGKSYVIPDGTPGHSVGGVGQGMIDLGDELPPAYRLRMDVRVDDPPIQAYLRSGLAEGWISLMASQLAIADIGLNGSYSYWLTKEGSATLPPVFDLNPSTLEFDYIEMPPGDFNGDGLIGPEDLGPAIEALTDPAGFERDHPLLDASALTDMDGDGDTDLADVAAVVRLLGHPATGGNHDATPR